ncbi:MAG: DUF4097 family beta strand repeat protein [Deltaproteobacteria bacterium]|jgi:hypothetical protein|nr:DUF4097 family beta strand repeat protein [Deltaproteobacteria bacterium]
MNENNPSIQRYIKILSRRLSHLSDVDRDDITREIKEHIVERWESDSKGELDEESLKGVLGKMGAPEAIAAQYCEQRGWAIPPKRHTVRNTILVAAALIVALCLGGGYFSYKYVLFPFLGMFKGSLVEIDDDGVRVFNDAISVSDEGVKIKGVIDIDAKGGQIKVGGIKIDGKFQRMNIGKLLLLKPAAVDKGEMSIPIKGSKGVDVEFINGKITVVGTDTTDVKIEFKKMVFGSDRKKAERILGEMDVTYKIDGSSIQIEGADPLSDRIMYPDGITGLAYEAEIKVPKWMKAEVECKNCNLNISSIKGPLDLEAKYGTTNVDNIESDTKIDGKYGTTEVKNIGGNLSADAKYGTIRLEGISGNLEIDSKYGEAKVGKVSGDINVDAKYGDVDLILQKDYGFTFIGESKFGDIDCSFPTKKKGKLLTAKIGDGKHKVTIDSKFGSIDVDIAEQ